MTKSKDGRAVARANELRILRALHRFGWLRTKDLGTLVWQEWAREPSGHPNLQPPISTLSGWRMAQKTLRRMRKARLVLSAKGPDGSVMYSNAEAGARLLRDMGLNAKTGKDQVRLFSSSHFRHRCISNELAIAGILQGFRASTEREISQGLWAGGNKGIAGKKPDVLLRDHRTKTWWFLEVERSRRNDKDYGILRDWLSCLKSSGLAKLSEEGRSDAEVAKVIFISTVAFRNKLRRDLVAAKWQESEIDALISFETSLYKFEDITFSK